MAVIPRSQLFPLLLEACPSYEAVWNTFLAEYADEPEPLSYVALAQFARHLSNVLAAGDQQSLRRVFDLLERLIIDGDADAQEATVVGIIKNLQNEHLHQNTKPDDYLPYLLPESERWWGKVRGFWINGRLLSED
ncbi:MAG TPA: hypothetical protein VJ813_10430 [Vicinamibacterales bacterium]|nr:hypothetical protein [Vicinamibacterales bacterium]